MNFQRFEGMGPAVGIVLIIMIVTWLGVWGPINLMVLQQWQTLIAGCLAICAACIAYWGSSATARHSAKVQHQEAARRKLALYLKLEFACRQLVDQARSAEVIFPPFQTDLLVEPQRFSIEEPAEIEEAWAFLDILPRPLISEMRLLRNSIREMAIIVRKNPAGVYRWRLGEAEAPYPLSVLSERANIIWQSAAVIAETLDPLIVAMAPEMDQSEKLGMIYGEPDHDDRIWYAEDHDDTASRQP